MQFLRTLQIAAGLSASTVVLALSGCSKNDRVQKTAQTTEAATKNFATEVKATVVESWETIKEYNYEKREDFAATLDRLAAKREAEIRELNAKLVGLPETAAKQRDRAMKDFNRAGVNLKTHIANLRTATGDTWADGKEKAGQAWQRLQSAYDDVKSSPTS